MVIKSDKYRKESSEKCSAFTLVEVLITFTILAFMVSGLIYGYVQSNRMAIWSTMSLAAQSYASQGAEQARAAQWDSRQWPPTNGPGTGDELLCPTNYQQQDTIDIPRTGEDKYITNYISVTKVSDHPLLRQIQSRCVWVFPLTGKVYTNTVIIMRAPDQ